MSNISQYSTTASSNNSVPPDGFPEGQAPSTVNDSMREVMAALAKWYKDTSGSLTSTGSSNAYVLTTNNAHAALADQSMLVFEVNHTNTSAATLNVDSLGAKAIQTASGAALTASAMQSGNVVALFYNASSDAYQMLGFDVVSVPFSFASTTAFTADITPGELSGDANDYSPTGLATANTIRLSSNASRTITGITGGADGRLLLLHNVGSNDIVLSDENASSTAANRFSLSADVTLGAEFGLIIQYDSTSSRWRAFNIPVSAATQAEQEAVTSNTAMVTPAVQHFHPSAAKAWCKWTGGASPTVSVGYNVASVARTSQGEYTVTLTTGFSTVNWAGIILAQHGSDGQFWTVIEDQTATTLRARFSGEVGDADPDGGMFMAFGDFT